MNIYAYNNGSASAKALAEALGIKRIKHHGSKFKGSPDKLVINWGASKLPDEVLKCGIFNPPHYVAIAANKHTALHAMCEVGVRVPKWTIDSQDVQAWLDNGHTVVVRHVLNGHSGEGIELLNGDVEIPDAPLYVQYMPKKEEYRVHVFNGEMVDVQRKARRQDVADNDVNWRIRNHANGFIFARNEDHEVPNDVTEQAVKAVKACGLDFGAVDVIWNDKQQLAYVLEVNTAPGLTGETLTGYVKRFKEFIHE